MTRRRKESRLPIIKESRLAETMVQQKINKKAQGTLADLKLPFPWKLQKLLEDTEQNETTDIVSWLDDGSSFKVHKPKTFTEEIMPSYFSQTKFNSFRRQCYIYGFRLKRDGAFFHPDFRRDNLEACLSLRRNQQEDRRRKKQHKDIGRSSVQDNLNFKLPSHTDFLSLPQDSTTTSSNFSNKPALSLFEKTFCSSNGSEAEEEIMDLAHDIFEKSQFFNETHSELLALDFTFKDVQLHSLDEVFLSEMSERQSTQRHNGEYNEVIIAL